MSWYLDDWGSWVRHGGSKSTGSVVLTEHCSGQHQTQPRGLFTARPPSAATYDERARRGSCVGGEAERTRAVRTWLGCVRVGAIVEWRGAWCDAAVAALCGDAR
jgi:hypothetical protein